MMDQVKMMAKMKKIQKELSKTIVEVEAGEGAVTIQMNGEQKIKDVSLDTELIDFDDIAELETWIEQAFKKAISGSQKVAQEKMQPIMGQLGNLAL